MEQKTTTPQTLTVTGARQSLSGQALTPNALGGYAFQSASLLASPTPTLHLRYSDGLTSVSLFETVRKSRKPSTLHGSRPIRLERGESGNVSQRYAYTVLNWDHRRLNLTLVGDLSTASMAELASEVAE